MPVSKLVWYICGLHVEAITLAICGYHVSCNVIYCLCFMSFIVWCVAAWCMHACTFYWHLSETNNRDIVVYVWSRKQWLKAKIIAIEKSVYWNRTMTSLLRYILSEPQVLWHVFPWFIVFLVWMHFSKYEFYLYLPF